MHKLIFEQKHGRLFFHFAPFCCLTANWTGQVGLAQRWIGSTWGGKCLKRRRDLRPDALVVEPVPKSCRGLPSSANRQARIPSEIHSTNSSSHVAGSVQIGRYADNKVRCIMSYGIAAGPVTAGVLQGKSPMFDICPGSPATAHAPLLVQPVSGDAGIEC